MKRRVTVTNETTGGLTTLARVKLELGITDSLSDALLERKIDEATSDIEQRIRPIRYATVVEELSPDIARSGYAIQIDAPVLYVSRYPIESMTSVVEDGTTIESSLYRILTDDHGNQHALQRLDGSGNPSSWCASKLITLTYVGGYIFPEETDTGLPPVLESAAIELLSSFWFAKGRDPMLKAEENPGVARFEYWVGAVGSAGTLPGGVMSKLHAFLKPPTFA